MNEKPVTLADLESYPELDDLEGVAGISSFDAAEFLDSKEMIAAYFTNALKTGDTEYLKKAVMTVSRAEKTLGIAKIAAHAKITREGAYRSLRKGTDPKMSTIMGILDAIGMQLAVVPNYDAGIAGAEAAIISAGAKVNSMPTGGTEVGARAGTVALRSFPRERKATRVAKAST